MYRIFAPLTAAAIFAHVVLNPASIMRYCLACKHSSVVSTVAVPEEGAFWFLWSANTSQAARIISHDQGRGSANEGEIG